MVDVAAAKPPTCFVRFAYPARSGNLGSTPMEVLACAKLHSGEGDASPLVNPSHHHVFTILHKENLL